MQKFSIIKSFVLVACFSIVNGIQFVSAQSEFNQPKKDYENANYLRHHAVLFSNGDTPFSENGKWGMRSVKGEVKLPAEFDSILFGGYDFCITVKNGKYGLLNKEYLRCLTIPMAYIQYIYLGFEALDSVGETSHFFVRDGILKPTEDGIYVINKKLNFRNTDLEGWTRFDYEGDILDYLLFPSANSKEKNHKLYLKNKEVIEVPNEEWSGLMDNRYLWLTDKQKQHSIIDLKTRKTVVKSNISEIQEVEVFHYLGKTFFQCHTFFPHSTIIFNEEGKEILNAPVHYIYNAGFLLKALEPHPNYYYDYEAYSFPELTKLTAEFCDMIVYDEFMLVNDCNGSYQLYGNGVLLKEWKEDNSEDIFFLGVNSSKNPAVYFSVEHTKGKLSELTVFAADGNLVYTSGYTKGKKFVSLNSDLGLADILGTKANGEEETLFTFTYDVNTKHKQIVSENAFDQLNVNVFEYLGENGSFLGNAEGKCVYDSNFEFIEILLYDSSRFAYLRKEGVSKICNDKLELICEDCEIAEDLAPSPQTVLPTSFFTIYYTKENVYRVFDSKGKLLLPDAYPAIFYHTAANNFVALTANGEIKYIPINVLKDNK